jgi:hypothetical protein
MRKTSLFISFWIINHLQHDLQSGKEEQPSFEYSLVHSDRVRYSSTAYTDEET